MLASKEKIDAFRKIVIGSVDEFWNKDDYLKNCPDGKINEYSEDELKDELDRMYHSVNDSFVTPWRRMIIDHMMINYLLDMLELRSILVIWGIL